jgi:hypothetical protein
VSWALVRGGRALVIVQAGGFVLLPILISVMWMRAVVFYVRGLEEPHGGIRRCRIRGEGKLHSPSFTQVGHL